MGGRRKKKNNNPKVEAPLSAQRLLAVADAVLGPRGILCGAQKATKLWRLREGVVVFTPKLPLFRPKHRIVTISAVFSPTLLQAEGDEVQGKG